jgi:hypothetical protein
MGCDDLDVGDTRVVMLFSCVYQLRLLSVLRFRS